MELAMQLQRIKVSQTLFYIIWRNCNFLLDFQFYKVDNGVVNF